MSIQISEDDLLIEIGSLYITKRALEREVERLHREAVQRENAQEEQPEREEDR